MKLDRNEREDGRGKYALLLMRSVDFNDQAQVDALAVLERAGVLDYGAADTSAEFFVIRLKDRSAAAALHAYAIDAWGYDPEWATEVRALAEKAYLRPDKKTPD